MSNLPGLFVLGEANFSDHGANRLGASALMQGLADGYFVIPYTLGDYLARGGYKAVSTDAPEFKTVLTEVKQSIEGYLSRAKKSENTDARTINEVYQQLGKIMWDEVGMARNEAGLKKAITEIQKLREEYRKGFKMAVSGGETGAGLNKSLEMAGRVDDFLELGELMAMDALNRSESCGGHFRVESQTPEGEAARNDDKFSYVAAWEYRKNIKDSVLHQEALVFENVKPTQRSYK
jgi:succinate dehydrogenase / fumarate reductase flavoprotein subunit